MFISILCSEGHVVKLIISIRFNVGYLVELFGGARGVILFTNPSARTGYDTRSIFKRSLTGLNSEFSFS